MVARALSRSVRAGEACKNMVHELRRNPAAVVRY
ncbi:MAG: hypothetical protein JWQ56_1276, partial [Pseudarthrobacter sp.]|nr:hypothetical protein [Pseudarthrobacter sp.]